MRGEPGPVPDDLQGDFEHLGVRDDELAVAHHRGPPDGRHEPPPGAGQAPCEGEQAAKRLWQHPPPPGEAGRASPPPAAPAPAGAVVPGHADEDRRGVRRGRGRGGGVGRRPDEAGHEDEVGAEHHGAQDGPGHDVAAVRAAAPAAGRAGRALPARQGVPRGAQPAQRPLPAGRARVVPQAGPGRAGVYDEPPAPAGPVAGAVAVQGLAARDVVPGQRRALLPPVALEAGLAGDAEGDGTADRGHAQAARGRGRRGVGDGVGARGAPDALVEEGQAVVAHQNVPARHAPMREPGEQREGSKGSLRSNRGTSVALLDCCQNVCVFCRECAMLECDGRMG